MDFILSYKETIVLNASFGPIKSYCHTREKKIQEVLQVRLKIPRFRRPKYSAFRTDRFWMIFSGFPNMIWQILDDILTESTKFENTAFGPRYTLLQVPTWLMKLVNAS